MLENIERIFFTFACSFPHEIQKYVPFSFVPDYTFRRYIPKTKDCHLTKEIQKIIFFGSPKLQSSLKSEDFLKYKNVHFFFLQSLSFSINIIYN